MGRGLNADEAPEPLEGLSLSRAHLVSACHSIILLLLCAPQNMVTIIFVPPSPPEYASYQNWLLTLAGVSSCQDACI